MIWGGWVIVQVWETPGLSWWCCCWHAGATDSARDDSDEDLGEQRMDLEEGWERRRWVERRGMMVMMRVGWSWWQWMEWSEEVAGDQSWPGNHEMRAEDDWRRSGDEEAVLESVEESWLETWRTGLISAGRWSWSCPASSSCSVLVLLLMRVALLLARCLLLLLLGSDLPTCYNSRTYNASTQLILTWSSVVKVESEGWDGSCVGWSESGNHCHQVDWSHLSHLQDMNHQDQDCQVQPDLSYNTAQWKLNLCRQEDWLRVVSSVTCEWSPQYHCLSGTREAGHTLCTSTTPCPCLCSRIETTKIKIRDDSCL